MMTLLDIVDAELKRVGGFLAWASDDGDHPSRLWFSLNSGPFIPFRTDLTALGMEDGDIARAINEAVEAYDPTIFPQLPPDRLNGPRIEDYA